MGSVRRFMNRYRPMVVLLDDGRQVEIDVHQYMINRASSSHNCSLAQAAWGTIAQHIRAEVAAANAAEPPPPRPARGHRHPHVHRHTHTRDEYVAAVDPSVTYAQLSYCAYGKGSPAAVAAFLRLAVRFGLTTADNLQRWADQRHVGIDCSGFVTNYLVYRGILRPVDVMNTNARSYDVPANRRAAIADVEYLDVMVWEDGGHVALIDSAVLMADEPVPTPHRHHGTHHHSHPAPPPPPQTRHVGTCLVVESNGGRGLAAETYTLESVNSHRVFTVRRENGHHFQVYIINRNIPPDVPSQSTGLRRPAYAGPAVLV